MVSIRKNVVCGPEEVYIPAHLSYGQYLFDQFVKCGDNVAVISTETGVSMTYKQILQCSVNAAASLRRMGLRKGDVVAISSENRFEFISAIFAVFFNGATISPLNITYSPGEITHLLNIAKPKYIFSSPLTAQNIYDCSKDLAFVEKIILFGDYDVVPGALMFEELVKTHSSIEEFDVADVNGVEDTVAVMCSSGTTGLPKGVMLTHVNLLTLSRHMHFYLENSQKKKKGIKTFMTVIPWFHAYGLVTTLAVLAMNVEVVFLVRFEEQQFLETIQHHKVNMLTIVPPLAVFLAKHPLVDKYDLTSLREIWCGAAPLSADIQNAVSKRTGLDFIKQGYGLTEVTMACCVDLTSGVKIGSCGTPAPGMKIKVVDIESGRVVAAEETGELWIKSPLRMKGYMGDAASSAALVDQEGFVRTGDIGYYDNEGFFYIIDRLKELIKYKGFQVPPAELEALLLQHAGVAECGVVGTPDELAGELPTAFVVRRQGAAVTQKELVEYVASKVSSAKRLRGGVIFVEQIPKNASGKILRRDLREMLPKPKSKL